MITLKIIPVYVLTCLGSDDEIGTFYEERENIPQQEMLCTTLIGDFNAKVDKEKFGELLVNSLGMTIKSRIHYLKNKQGRKWTWRRPNRLKR